MSNQKTKYVIIIPARNEEKFIESTINAITSQTIVPAKLVIVNDGSTDRTAEIIGKWAKQYNWIHLLNRKDRGHRQAGIGVMQTFYTGYSIVKSDKWDFIVKLDADITFDNDYFERSFDHFVKNPKLGIGGGILYSKKEGALISEKNPAFHVRGATKIIRRECWEAIGGFPQITGWDTLDEVKANMLGWQTYSFSDPICFQERLTGAEAGSWKNFVKNGRANYICGYHPLFMFAKCISRILEKPYLFQSFAFLNGYFSGYIKGIRKIDDQALIKYLRKQQFRRLMGRQSIWK